MTDITEQELIDEQEAKLSALRGTLDTFKSQRRRPRVRAAKAVLAAAETAGEAVLELQAYRTWYLRRVGQVPSPEPKSGNGEMS